MTDRRYSITDDEFDLEIEPATLTVPVQDLEASTEDRPVYLNITYYVWLEDDGTSQTVQFEYDHATRTGRDIDYRDLEMIEIVTGLLDDVGVPTRIPSRMDRDTLRRRRGRPDAPTDETDTDTETPTDETAPEPPRTEPPRTEPPTAGAATVTDSDAEADTE